MSLSTIRASTLMGVFIALLVVILSQPTSAQSGVTWTAQYYNNRYLSGDPVVERQEGAVSFNWGAGSPLPEVQADYFSVRWAADPYFPAGTYRFYVLADDNVALRVGFPFDPQIDTFNDPAVGQIRSVDITLEAGTHHVQVDYRENTGNAYVYLSWANVATNPTGPNFPVPQQPVPVGGVWAAHYFANASLSGAPTAVFSEGTPSHNWGAGSPAANIPADNFSARWTSVQTFNAGTYQLTARADDGVRVYVDGILYIDEWHLATAATYTAVINLAAGQHTVQVEYFESGGMAWINFTMTPTFISPPPVVVNPPSSTTGTVVTALRLNVRSQPTTQSNVLVKINRNESYPVIGRNADNSWWQIDVNGTRGWVYWRFFDVDNPQAVPLVTLATGSSLDQPPTTGYFARTLATVNVRSEPNTASAILGQVARGNQLPVVGRNASNTWWQVNFGQITGWVSSRFAPLQSNAVVSQIPVTG